MPTKQHLREVLLHYFILKKSATESYRLLVEVYGDNAPSEFKEIIAIDFNNLETVISMCKTKNILVLQKSLKMKNWKHYWMQMHVKHFKNCQKY